MTKQQCLADPQSCLNKAHDDEPLFVLRANDPLAPLLIEMWTVLSDFTDLHEPQKRFDAVMVSEAMQAWRRQRGGEPPIELVTGGTAHAGT